MMGHASLDLDRHGPSWGSEGKKGPDIPPSESSNVANFKASNGGRGCQASDDDPHNRGRMHCEI